MPQMANITVKKNDGTTDIVYTQKIASAGDSSPAIWRSDSVGTAASQRPELHLVSQWNGPRTARRVTGDYVYPTLVTGTDGKVSVADKFVLKISGVVPQGMPDVDLNEAVTQGLNLAAAALIKDSFKTGFAPT